jgi:hypothetical protein
LIWKLWSRFRSGCPRFRLAAIFLAWAALAAGLAPGFAQAPEEGAPGEGTPKEGTEDRLRIDDVQFEDEHGDVRYSLITGAGTQIVMSFRVQGFERRRIEEQGEIPEERVRLQYEAELRDPQGVLVVPEESGEVDTVLGPRDREWTPRIRWSAPLPAHALSGQYKIELRVQDVQSGEGTTASVPVRVRGETVQPGAPFGVQQLQYANTRNGPWFPRRFFAPKRPIHVRYKVAGFEVSPDNEVWVEQDWAVIDAEGNVLVSQQNVVVEHETSFYPPRYLSTVLELALDDPKPGTYTFRITIRDRVSGQTNDHDSEFAVRP